MLADGAEAALLQARTVVAAATEPDPRGAHGVTVMALREAIATTIAKLHVRGAHCRPTPAAARCRWALPADTDWTVCGLWLTALPAPARSPPSEGWPTERCVGGQGAECLL